MKMKNKSIFIILIAAFIYGSIISFFIYMMVTYSKLNDELEQRGVPTTAIIIECRSSQNVSSAIYQYEAQNIKGQVKTYQVKNVGGGRPNQGCQEGEEVTLYYLPEKPEQALSKSSSYVSMSIIGLIVSGFVLLSLFYEFYKERKN